MKVKDLCINCGKPVENAFGGEEWVHTATYNAACRNHSHTRACAPRPGGPTPGIIELIKLTARTTRMPLFERTLEFPAPSAHIPDHDGRLSVQTGERVDVDLVGDADTLSLDLKSEAHAIMITAEQARVLEQIVKGQDLLGSKVYPSVTLGREDVTRLRDGLDAWLALSAK